MSRDSSRGQSAVEVVAVVPALLALALVAWWLASGAATWLQAGSAARAAARAAVVGEQAEPVARRVTGGGSGVRVHVRADTAPLARVRVDVAVPGPWGWGRVWLPVEAEAAAP